MSDGTATESLHRVRFPNESAEYRRARDVLLEAEIALRRQIEATAQLRRSLPPGGEVPEDYVFQEGEDAHPVRLSELFAGKPTLIAYSFMFGPKVDRPCPNCTAILDALDGEAQHVNQRASLVVVAKSPIARIRAFAAERGWRSLRLLSSATNSYNADYHGETATGGQTSTLNVFNCTDGAVRHSFAPELQHMPVDPGQSPRHVDSIWPMWNLFDFTPDGRGKDHPKLQYGGSPPIGPS
jgi:predicted dithiol-disulfide oxidoreductase (DUF899 family)